MDAQGLIDYKYMTKEEMAAEYLKIMDEKKKQADADAAQAQADLLAKIEDEKQREAIKTEMSKYFK